jgi:hypothetical protein
VYCGDIFVTQGTVVQMALVRCDEHTVTVTGPLLDTRWNSDVLSDPRELASADRDSFGATALPLSWTSVRWMSSTFCHSCSVLFRPVLLVTPGSAKIQRFVTCIRAIDEAQLSLVRAEFACRANRGC